MLKLKLPSKSSSGKTVHLIYHEIDNPKSWAAGLLLNNFYWNQDPDNPRHKYEARINFSRTFLTMWKEKHGSIKCSYCSKDNLEIEYEGMQIPHHIMATIDHVHPISKGGAIFDTKNVVPCCYKCNQKKGNKLLHEFQKTR
jgi:5-methylcytosine-specific restriction endonuclease McrA